MIRVIFKVYYGKIHFIFEEGMTNGREFKQQRKEITKQQTGQQTKNTPEQSKSKTKTVTKEAKHALITKQEPKVATVPTVKRIEGGELARMLAGKTSTPSYGAVHNNPNIKTAQQLLEELQRGQKD